jgi:hypothetical protein
MSYTLKNEELEIQIDLPLSNYNFSRFDWTGKIIAVKYKNILITGVERPKNEDNSKSGKGFYNEFGISEAIGYDETEIGNWFHKIGIGLLKKEAGDYQFFRNYEIRPASFTVNSNPNKITISCKSELVNGYSYILIKEISIVGSSFIVHYYLKNTGEKTLKTTEYTHNFIAIDQELLGSDYILKFPFCIKPELFEENLNTEGKIEIGLKEITFNATPNEQFYFSNLSGNESVDASWEVINTKNRIGIRETGDFKTNKVNLWGWKHVLCPELLFEINLLPSKEVEWSRTFTAFETI